MFSIFQIAQLFLKVKWNISSLDVNPICVRDKLIPGITERVTNHSSKKSMTEEDKLTLNHFHSASNLHNSLVAATLTLRSCLYKFDKLWGTKLPKAVAVNYSICQLQFPKQIIWCSFHNSDDQNGSNLNFDWMIKWSSNCKWNSYPYFGPTHPLFQI